MDVQKNNAVLRRPWRPILSAAVALGVTGIAAMCGAGTALAQALPNAAQTSNNAGAALPDAAVGAAAESAQPFVVVEGLDPDGRLKLSVNKSRLLVTGARLRSADQNGAALTAGSADIAMVSPVSANSILVTAKKAGSTNLIIEDEQGRRQVVEVIVETDLAALRQQLSSLSTSATIDATDDNGSLILRGRVPSLKIADQAAQIAGAFYVGKVVNLLEVSGGQQVMLQVKFAEVSKMALSELGVNFGYTDGSTFIGNNVAGVNPFGVSAADLFMQKLAGGSPGSNIQMFGNIKFNSSAFAYFINCLRENQLMRTLAEPNLTAISGEQASFQVGGTIPIPVPQQGGGNGASGAVITIQYQPYGVLLHFTPVVLGDGRIRLKIDPEVSDIDESNAVTISGFKIPAFTTRTVDTTVELADGQTFTIAGLLSNKVSSTADSMPGLGDLPILGTLFRSVQYQRNQTELVVMVTPRLVEAVNPEQVTAVTGEHWRYPTEADLFISRDLGGVATEKGGPVAGGAAGVASQAPSSQFKGQYGFTPTDGTLVVEP